MGKVNSCIFYEEFKEQSCFQNSVKQLTVFSLALGLFPSLKV